MSDDKDDEITRIEDLPDLDRGSENEEETDFTDLESMAQSMGLDTPPLDAPPSDMPELPNDDDASDFGLQDESLDNSIEENETWSSDASSFENESDNSLEENFQEEGLDGPPLFDEESENQFDSFTEEDQDLSEDFEDSANNENQFSDDFQEESDFTESNEEEGFNLHSPPDDDYSGVLSTPEFQNSDEVFNDLDENSSNGEEIIHENPIMDLNKKRVIENKQLSTNLDKKEIVEKVHQELSSNLISAEELIQNYDISDDENRNITKTEIKREERTSYQSHNFDDVKDFAQKSQIGDYSVEGNPPFSIILKSIRYYEDLDEILEILIEHKIILADQLESTRSSLELGQYLIPRLGEFAAIMLCHKLRRYDLEIIMGLTEEVNPPKSYSSNDKGMTNKHTIFNNKRFYLKVDESFEKGHVLTSTLGSVEGHHIRDYIGIVSHAQNYTPEEIQDQSLDENLYQFMSKENQARLEALRLKRENILASQSRLIDRDILTAKEAQKHDKLKIDHIYEQLVDELKNKAMAQKANGIVGINFTITPISIEQIVEKGPQYQVLCTGNLVWLEKTN